MREAGLNRALVGNWMLGLGAPSPPPILLDDAFRFEEVWTCEQQGGEPVGSPDCRPWKRAMGVAAPVASPATRSRAPSDAVLPSSTEGSSSELVEGVGVVEVRVGSAVGRRASLQATWADIHRTGTSAFHAVARHHCSPGGGDVCIHGAAPQCPSSPAPHPRCVCSPTPPSLVWKHTASVREGVSIPGTNDDTLLGPLVLPSLQPHTPEPSNASCVVM